MDGGRRPEDPPWTEAEGRRIQIPPDSSPSQPVKAKRQRRSRTGRRPENMFEKKKCCAPIKHGPPNMPAQSKYTSTAQRQKAARQRVVAAKRSYAPRPRMAISNYRTGGFLGIEYKFVDQTKGATLLVATNSGAEIDPATNNCLNAVPVGDTESARDGRKYTITGCHIRGVLYRQNRNGQTEGGDANFVTLALVLDTQTNGAQAQSEEVFTIPSGGVASLPFQNLQNSQRFKVLWKRTIVVPAGNIAYDGTDMEAAGTAVPFSIDKPLKTIVNCTGTGATVADIADNSLHLIAFADVSAANANGIEIKYNSRVRFVG